MSSRAGCVPWRSSTPCACRRGRGSILRLDGRGFSRFTETRFEKPFDARFHDGMVQTAQAVLEDLQGLYAYTESDEISVLFPRDWDLFDRELEKAVSLSAGLASAAFSLACGTRVHFDSRAVLAAEDEQVVDYFRWRQADAARCALNGWTYWTLRKAGQGVAEATAALEGKSVADKNELLFQAGHQLQRSAAVAAARDGPVLGDGTSGRATTRSWTRRSSPPGGGSRWTGSCRWARSTPASSAG